MTNMINIMETVMNDLDQLVLIWRLYASLKVEFRGCTLRTVLSICLGIVLCIMNASCLMGHSRWIEVA